MKNQQFWIQVGDKKLPKNWPKLKKNDDSAALQLWSKEESEKIDFSFSISFLLAAACCDVTFKGTELFRSL